MSKIIALVDKSLRHVSYKADEASVTISAKSISKQAICPYCKTTSKKVHSRYVRKLQDLPIQGKKVKLLLEIKKYFCFEEGCTHKTFAETFALFSPNATKTKRLQEEILKISLNQSSLSAAKYLKGNVADVGKSTICTMLKKIRNSH